MATVRKSALRQGLGSALQLARKAVRKSPRQIVDRLALALLDPPTDLVLDVSTRCNLRCIMCSLDAYGPGRDMDLETVKALAPTLSGVRHISLTCSGEPHLNPHLFDMILCIKGSSNATVGLFTNGTLLTQEIARELVRLGLDWIVISLDAAKGETYAEIRGADLDRTLKNVRGLQRAKQELGSALPSLSIGFVALRSNVAELPAVVRLAAELGAGEVRVHGLEPYGEEIAAQIVYAPEAAHLRRHFEVALDEARRLGIRMMLPRLEIGLQRRCRPFPHVAWDGTLRPCGELVYARPFYLLGEKKRHSELSFGNVREESFQSLWWSPDYKRFRRSLARREFPQVCDGCPMSYGVIC